MIMPSYGPLSLFVPRPVSMALLKLLLSKKIEVVPYTQIRYIGGKTTLPNNLREIASIALYCCKSYDSLDSVTIGTDAVGICMDLHPGSPHGDPNNFVKKAHLELDNEGAIIVNQSLMATANVYVAGESCSVYTRVGRGSFSGSEFQAETGAVAGTNMCSARPEDSIVFDSIPVNKLPILSKISPHQDQNTKLFTHCASPNVVAEIQKKNDVLEVESQEPEHDEKIANFVFIGLCLSSLESHYFSFDSEHEPIEIIHPEKENHICSSSSSTSTVDTATPGASFATLFMASVYRNVSSRFSRDLANEKKSVATVKVKGKLGMKKISKASKVDRNRNRSTIGLGVTIYVDDGGIIVGMSFNSPQGVVQYDSNIDIVINRCKSIVEKNLSVLTLKAQFSDGLTSSSLNFSSEQDQPVQIPNSHLLGEKVKELEALRIISTSVIEPLLGRKQLTSPVKSTYRYSAPSVHVRRNERSSSILPTAYTEQLFQTKNIGTNRSDRVSAAYSRIVQKSDP